MKIEKSTYVKLSPIAIFAAFTGVVGIFHSVIFSALGTSVKSSGGHFLSLYAFAVIGMCELIYAVIVAKKHRSVDSGLNLYQVDQLLYSSKGVRIGMILIVTLSISIIAALSVIVQDLDRQLVEGPSLGGSVLWWYSAPLQLTVISLFSHALTAAIGIFSLIFARMHKLSPSPDCS